MGRHTKMFKYLSLLGLAAVATANNTASHPSIPADAKNLSMDNLGYDNCDEVYGNADKNACYFFKSCFYDDLWNLNIRNCRKACYENVLANKEHLAGKNCFSGRLYYTWDGTNETQICSKKVEDQQNVILLIGQKVLRIQKLSFHPKNKNLTDLISI